MATEITEEQIDRAFEFERRGTYLDHPNVRPFEGTAFGDDINKWRREWMKAFLQFAMDGKTDYDETKESAT